MKNKEVERLRALAVLFVVNAHFVNLAPLPIPPFSSGLVGVELFFVISGYVICNSLLKLYPDLTGVLGFMNRFRRASTAIKVFYTRRFFRIFPLAAMWVIVHLVCAYLDVEHRYWAPPNELVSEAYTIMTLWNNYYIAHAGHGNIGVYWSLMIEEHFYMLFPLFLVVFGTKRRRIEFACLGIFVAAFVIRGIFAVPLDDPQLTYLQRYPTHRVFDGLLAGALISFIRSGDFGKGLIKVPAILKQLIGATVLTGICVGPSLLPNGYEQSITLEVGISFVLVFLASFEAGYIFEWPGVSKILEMIGNRSYGIYLIHRFGIQMAQLALSVVGAYFSWRWQSLAMIYASFVVLTVAITEICFRFIEKPLIAVGTRISNRMIAKRLNNSQKSEAA